MRVFKIIKGTCADGPGLRNSVYVAGCDHKCPGCHNPETWDFSSGTDMTIDDVLKEIIDDFTNVTISGGDPAYQSDEVTELCKRLKQLDKNVWLFTGFKYADLTRFCPEMIKYIDVLVDGEYIANKRDLTRFCGSSNQRILHLKDGEIEYEE